MGINAPRCVVFDLDGTLADTSGDLIAAANAALEVLGHAPQLVPGRDDAVAVRGARRMLAVAHARLGLTGAEAEAGIEAGYPHLLAAYDGAIDTHTTLYPGAVAAVERLRAGGMRTAICTNKPEGLAEKLVRSLGVRDLFDALIGADTLPVRKPDAAPYFAAVDRAGGKPDRSVLIGDSETDRATATAAGVPCILVGFGPDTRAAMEALAPEALLDHYDDLSRVVEAVLPD